MYKRFRHDITAALTSAVISTLCAPTMAADRTSRHTLGSGPDVYRLEIRNLNRFEVLETGDSDGIGELHELKVALRTFNSAPPGSQHDILTFSGTELYLINEGGIVGGKRYFPIRLGQHVFTSSDRRANATTQLWVHVNTSSEAANNVRLSVEAEELDCAGQRVCGRRGHGGVTIEFQIPTFMRRPSNRCGTDNTFRLELLDGELQISNLSNTTVFDYANSRSLVLGVNHDAGGPRLRPFNADICIASTIRP